VFDFAGTYDELNPDDRDHRFYAALAAERGAARVVDLGCGTGSLARRLVAAGRTVVGIDPDPEMLRVARRKVAADFRLGSSDRVDPDAFDLAVMSGHAAQVFVAGDDWDRVLRDLHRGLVPGGTLAFESRDPAAAAWRHWTRERTLRTAGTVEFWHETVDVSLPLVTYDTYAWDRRTGARTSRRDVLAFRDQAALTRSLTAAGFTVEAVYGDWDRTPPGAGTPEIIVVARR
jgi:SAM-dependent methyltransferase